MSRSNPLDLSPTDGLATEFTVQRLLGSGSVCVRHVDCRGSCRHRSAEESASHTHFVFPYRGLYLRHVGHEQTVADANHVLLFNEGRGYQVRHPVRGGDASLRRWTLADIAAEIRGSPVYLTQVFQQVEGMPLYRYHLRLRLARALDLIANRDDLSALAHDLGFSSHSHFAAAFKRVYGVTPAAFRDQSS